MNPWHSLSDEAALVEVELIWLASTTNAPIAGRLRHALERADGWTWAMAADLVAHDVEVEAWRLERARRNMIRRAHGLSDEG